MLFRSRCQRFDFRRITADDISKRLQEIAAAENIELTTGGAALLARLADGAMRDALSMLDRTAGCTIVDEAVVSTSLGLLDHGDATALMIRRPVRASPFDPAQSKSQ